MLEINSIVSDEAASYARVSTVQQEEDGTSLATQQAANHAMAQRLGFKINPKFDWLEQASSADNSRPKFIGLQGVVSERLVAAVFAFSPDRIARDPLELLQFVRLCKDSGVALYFADGTSVATAEDEALTFLRGYFGSREREQIVERTMRGKEAVARSGRMPCGYSKGIYGYVYAPELRALVPDEAEAAVVQTMYQWRIDGMAVFAIARRLNQIGIPTKHGCKWEARQVHSVLSNSTYAGRPYYRKFRHKLVNGKRVRIPLPKSEWILVENFAPAIVSEAVFDAVQEKWDAPVSPDRPKKREYLFTRLIRCALCGRTMCGSTQEYRGRIYAYYRCNATVPDAKGSPVCRAVGVRAEALEETIWEHVAAAVRDPSALIADLRQHWDTGTGRLGRRIERLNRDIRKCRTEQMRMVQQHARGLIDQQMLDDLIAPAAALLAKHQRDLDVLLAQQKLQDAADEAEERIRRAFATYAEGLSDLTVQAKHALLERLKVKVVASKERVLVTAEIDPGLFTIEHTLA